MGAERARTAASTVSCGTLPPELQPRYHGLCWLFSSSVQRQVQYCCTDELNSQHRAMQPPSRARRGGRVCPRGPCSGGVAPRPRRPQPVRPTPLRLTAATLRRVLMLVQGGGERHQRAHLCRQAWACARTLQGCPDDPPAQRLVGRAHRRVLQGERRVRHPVRAAHGLWALPAVAHRIAPPRARVRLAGARWEGIQGLPSDAVARESGTRHQTLQVPLHVLDIQ